MCENHFTNAQLEEIARRASARWKLQLENPALVSPLMVGGLDLSKYSFSDEELSRAFTLALHKVAGHG
ncbi:MAG: hypothetical protein V4463_15615 [Pseudomonadota bacterium]